MATKHQRLAVYRWKFEVLKTGIRWYMRNKGPIELLAQWSVSLLLVGGGIYAVTEGYPFAASVGFAGAALTNFDLWQLMYALRHMSKQPPPSQFQYDNEQEPPTRNRRND